MNSGSLPDGAQMFLDIAHWIAVAAPYMAIVIAAGLIAACGISWRRALLVRDALAGRVRVETVPTSTFDPGEGEVRRWSQHLGRVSYAAGGTPRRGRAARLHYSARNGRMHCYLEGHPHAQAVLTMPGFAEVEIRASGSRCDIQPVRFPVPAPRRSRS
ncbi:putative secreted protein [Streptomyces coelicolor A3(2)]|jgi:hypothetical protein|uniref:Secreted protein n=3 Tax=Streptomyces TaxID=1883 RepID=Q9ACZ8_STRCO|nr:secreted protein [Streptomyces coelicolor]CAC36674.1 putative secreted protein [Streptomyces coelicolor A3(2)]